MDDAVPVRELDRIDDRHEQLDPLPHGELPARGVRDQVLTFDVLEGEEPAAIGSAAAVEKARDARMIERGEDAHLVDGSGAQPRRRRPSRSSTLTATSRRKCSVSSIGQEDPSHAAAAELAHDAVGADPLG